MGLYLDASPNDLRAAVAKANVLTTLGRTQAELAIRHVIESYGWTISDYRISPGGRYDPYISGVPFYIFVNQSFMFIFIGGVLSPEIGRLVWDGYTGEATPFQGEPVAPENTYFGTMAEQIDAVIPRVWWTSRSIYFVTHSAGAGVARLLMRRNLGVIPAESRVELTAFGAPKLRGWSAEGLGAFTDFTCWINSNDPVPEIPPRPTTWERIMSGLSAIQGRRISMFAHNPGGVNLMQDGSLRPSNIPLELPSPPITAIGEWLAASAHGMASPHSIETYYARLTASLALRGPGTPVAAQDNANPRPEIPSRQRLVRIQDDLVATMFSDLSREQRGTVILPPQNTFTVQRFGRVYWVYFGGVPVMAAPFRRRARGLARVANDLLRRMQRQAFVDLSAFVPSLEEYLRAASDPEGGFSPVMNTELP